MSKNAAPPALLDAINSMAPDTPPPAVPGMQARLADLVEEALELRNVTIPAQEEVLKAAKARFDELRKILIPEAMQHTGLVDRHGKGSFTHSSGARIHLSTKVYANVLAGDRPKLLQWLRDHGHQDLIKEDVHHQTLTAFCKEQQEDPDGEVPPMVKMYPEVTASFTSPKGKEQ